MNKDINPAAQSQDCKEKKRTGWAWTNTEINGELSPDANARIQDDFNLAVNRDYVLGLKIPEGKQMTGGLYETMFSAEERRLDMVNDETLTGHDADLVHTYYGLLRDWETRNSNGIRPLKKYVDEIRVLNSLDEMTAYFADEERGGIFGSLIECSVAVSLVDPEARMISVSPTSLSLGDSAEYREMSENGRTKKKKNEAGWRVILSELGFEAEEAETIIANAFAMETKMAENVFTLEEQYAPEIFSRMWNPTDLAGAGNAGGSFPVVRLLESWGAGKADLYNIDEPEYMKSLDSIYTEDNFEALRDWYTIKVLDGADVYLDRKTHDAARDAINQVMGISGTEKDEIEAVNLAFKNLSLPMDNLYIQKYCTPAMREEIEKMIRDIISEYREMLGEEDWLSAKTREKAVEKLEAMRIRAVYPYTPEEWDDLTIDAEDNLLDATLKILNYRRKRELAKVNEKVDKEKWDQNMIPASMVNAFYNPQDNSINILAGILNGVVYDSAYSYEQKLGALAIVIGHEASHAFDPQGSQFDKDGKFASWWTDEDKAAFEHRAEKLIAYYDQLEPVEGIHYSGKRVQGEAIADMGGMKCSLRVAAKIRDFDYRKFFETYARIWSTTFIRSAEIDRARTDPHPLGYLRINIPVQQFDEFIKTYDVKEGDGMYIAPQDRICVW